MPKYVVQKTLLALNDHEKSVKGARILIEGVAYKKDINDVRESPALDIMSELISLGADISYHDEFVPELDLNGTQYQSVSLSEAELKQSDCVVIVTNHSALDVGFVVEHAKLIVDTRNVTKGMDGQGIWRI
ncbi:MAG: hypothetical protein HRT90_05095 [Candidatus Margulisbacteria bacterium]|nr:hypothetical protein [Candidatus Margulisiibacteriota bacterium]